jgi:hypothetical protein
MSGKSALPANHFPDRFALDPSWLGSESVRFAFVMRFEPQDPTTRFEGARACTVGTFHERNATRKISREINGNHPRKRACGGFGGLLLVRLDSAPGRRLVLSRKSLIHLFCGCRSRFLRLGIRGRDLFLPCGLRWRGLDAWSCSINNPAYHDVARGVKLRLEASRPAHRFPQPRSGPFQGRGDELHQVIHRYPATVGGVEDRLREPGVDGS